MKCNNFSTCITAVFEKLTILFFYNVINVFYDVFNNCNNIDCVWDAIIMSHIITCLNVTVEIKLCFKSSGDL